MLGQDFAIGRVTGTDGQVMNDLANEEMYARGWRAGRQGPGGRETLEPIGYSSNDNDNNGGNNQRPTCASCAVRCSIDDDVRYREGAIKVIPPANWYL